MELEKQHEYVDVDASIDFTIDDIIFEAGEMPVVPQVNLKLIDLTNNPKVSPSVVENAIETDQGITARVLALANSPYYGVSRRIFSVREALVVLGYKAINNLAASTTSFNNFLGKGDPASLAKRDLWRHALTAGLCSKIVCKFLKPSDAAVVDPAEAFAAAFLHDMGKMAILSVFPDLYTSAFNASIEANLPFHKIELDYLPYSHTVVGNAMAERWSMPETLCDAILNHHAPMEAQTIPQIVAVVTMADEISQGRREAMISSADEWAESDPIDDAAAILNFNPDVVHGIKKACWLEMDKGISLMSFD